MGGQDLVDVVIKVPPGGPELSRAVFIEMNGSEKTPLVYDEDLTRVSGAISLLHGDGAGERPRLDAVPVKGADQSDIIGFGPLGAGTGPSADIKLLILALAVPFFEPHKAGTQVLFLDHRPEHILGLFLGAKKGNNVRQFRWRQEI